MPRAKEEHRGRRDKEKSAEPESRTPGLSWTSFLTCPRAWTSHAAQSATNRGLLFIQSVLGTGITISHPPGY